MAIHCKNVGNFEVLCNFGSLGLKPTPAPLLLEFIFIGISIVEHNFLVNISNSLYTFG